VSNTIPIYSDLVYVGCGSIDDLLKEIGIAKKVYLLLKQDS